MHRRRKWKRRERFPTLSKFAVYFAVIFAINAWFNIFVAATYLPVRLTPKIFHLSVSHRKFLANYIVCMCDLFYMFMNWMMLKAHLRNQKLSLRRISSNYPRKLKGVLAVVFAICLTPKIFHLSNSHRKFLANYREYERIDDTGSFLCVYKSVFALCVMPPSLLQLKFNTA